MHAEQLPLPRLRVKEKGPVGVVLFAKDAATPHPKVLIARRPNGIWTFPGGKLRWWMGEWRNPARGTRREIREETGIPVWSDEYLVEMSGSPVHVAADRAMRRIHVFLAFSDECAPSDIPQRREPAKNGPWRYAETSELEALVVRREMHPFVMQLPIREAMDEAREAEEYALNRDPPRAIRPSGAARSEPGFLVWIHEREPERALAV